MYILDKPSLLGSISRHSLACLPTPVQSLDRLRELLGQGCPRLLVKRDDLTGLGAGGNKGRKLEFLVADAIKKNCNMLVTCGAAQSNHALQTSAAASRAGLKAACVLFAKSDSDKASRGNVRLHGLLGTKISWVYPVLNETKAETLARSMEALAANLRDEGFSPYVIPSGGSNAIGMMGYVNAVEELRAQLGDLGELSAFYFASGSGGTHAGLALGLAALNWNGRLIGVEVDPTEVNRPLVGQTFQEKIEILMGLGAQKLTLDEVLSIPSIELIPDFAGPEYGMPTQECLEAMDLLAKTEGIFVDPVYTGKALSALINHVRQGRYRADETVLFWHTGGLPGLLV